MNDYQSGYKKGKVCAHVSLFTNQKNRFDVPQTYTFYPQTSLRKSHRPTAIIAKMFLYFTIVFLADLISTVTAHSGHVLADFSERSTVPVYTFGYDDAKWNGPHNWYGMDPAANALCAHGKQQSPIGFMRAIS